MRKAQTLAAMTHQKERLLVLIITNRRCELNRTHPVGLIMTAALAGIPRQSNQKEREETFASFSFGDKVVDEDPEGFGGCAKRKRLR